MKKAIKGLMVMSAVVSSFLVAQVASADNEVEIEIIEGYVNAVNLCTTSDECTSMDVKLCAIVPKGNGDNAKTFVECTDESVTVWGLGPIDYWENYVVAEDIIGVAYPVVGDYVIVAADYRDCDNKYVAISMDICDVDNGELINCESIDLRDEFGDILWNQ
jgi:hypothetical protein